MFKFGIVVTGVWIIFVTILAITRNVEWSPLFKIDAEHLTLNEIGDTLAGFFAPLAFFWFFVATWMQRKELQLQREELAENRSILNQQTRELENSAIQSKTQTILMQQTLEATLQRDSYRVFGIELAYLAKEICTHHQAHTFPLEIPSRTIPAIGQMTYRTVDELQIDNESTIDLVFDDVLKFLMKISNDIQCEHWGFLNTNGSAYMEYCDYMNNLAKKLAEITRNQQAKKNVIIRARVDGLQLEKTVNMLGSLAEDLKLNYSIRTDKGWFKPKG